MLPSASEPIWYPQLDLPDGLIIAQTCRFGGVSTPPWNDFNLGLNSGEDRAQVLENRVRLRAALPGGPTISWLRQVHGNRVVGAQGREADSEPDADAVLTDESNLVCAVLTADCVPVLLYRLDGSACAAVHAGWKGLAGGVIGRACEAMGNTGSIGAWIGPCIRQVNYQIDEPLVVQLRNAQVPALKDCLEPSVEDHWLLDLAGLASAQLRAAGVARIDDCAECTFENSRLWYSFRRDGVTGRQASLIWRTSDS